MDWATLLSRQRYGSKPVSGKEEEERSDFERDFDRVVYSSPFRRLQDKTQVIPLPKHDFVHTRLTHSLEVSCVGRSLGRKAGNYLLENTPSLKKEIFINSPDIGAIVAAASLAHDIGNPPFGHSGESAISEFFLNGKGQHFKEIIDDPLKWADLTHFEGNANGFRILTNPSKGNQGGIRLTYATLAAFTKYPKESLPVYKKENRPGASEKKYGFFQSEKDIFNDIAQLLQLKEHRRNGYKNWCRHPLAFLVEAADDICYSIIDFEDGLRLGLIPPGKAEELLSPIIGDDFSRSTYNQIGDFDEQIGYLRAKVINTLVADIAQIFINNEQDLLQGNFDRSLIKASKFYEQVEAIKAITREKVYQSRNVLEIESVGFEVLGGLLDLFTGAISDVQQEKSNGYSRKIFELIPNQFLENNRQPHPDIYTNLIRICEFVAGMTDSYAISLYRKLKGIELPI